MDKAFSREKVKFSSSIFKPSLRFKEPIYERKYQKKKLRKKNVFIVIVIALLFSFLFHWLIYTENFLEDKLDIPNSYNNRILQNQRNSSSRSQDNTVSTKDNKRNSKRNSSELYIILPGIGTGVEVIIWCIPPIKFLRGFSIIIFTVAGQIVEASNKQKSFQTKNPYYDPTSIFHMFSLLVICNIYSYNWIIGSIQILIIILGQNFNLLQKTWSMDYEMPFQAILSIICALTLCITNYELEYYQRKIFYQRMESKLERNAFHEILKNLPSPLIFVQQEQVKWFNDAFKEIAKFNYDAEVLFTNSEPETNRQLKSILPFPNGYNEILNKIINQQENYNLSQMIENKKDLNKEEFVLENKDMKKMYFEISTIQFQFKGIESKLYLINDLSTFKKINGLKSKKKYQRVYFSSITHDFRTPLSIISGNAELLLYDEINPEKIQFINHISNASSMLYLLVQDILDFSQVKAGELRINIVEFDINAEFLMIINLFQDKYKNKGLFLNLTIDNNVPRKIQNDGNRIKQILVNLISNAFKFTLKGGVTVSISCNEITGVILVKVQDTGVGISEEDKGKLFKEFGKLERNSNLNPNGVGLGLRICQKIIHSLGGDISVESEPNFGSTFQYTFPSIFLPHNQETPKQHLNSAGEVEEEKEARQDSKVVPIDSSINHQNCNENYNSPIMMKEPKHNLKVNNDMNCSCPRILIADDDFSTLSLVTNYSKRLHVLSDGAENGMAALEKVKLRLQSGCCKYYEIIFIDFYMPLMNGIDASVEIKKELSLQNDSNITKIILISGISLEEETIIKNVNPSPFYLVEPKPLSFIKFKGIIEALLN